jgi:hypothetical protein
VDKKFVIKDDNIKSNLLALFEVTNGDEFDINTLIS